jgi:hypothetical protein
MNLSQMYGLVSARLNEAFPIGPTFFPTLEIVAALNEADRCFTLLTLALEVTSPWAPTAGQTFTHMLTPFPDWLVPLRIANPAGAKVRPARLSYLWSLDSQWPNARGPAQRYAAQGADLVALYPTPVAPAPLSVTYARAPVAMVNDSDTPETPVQWHPLYVGYAVYRLRQVEGGDPWRSTLPLLAEFLDGCQEYGNYMRARNVAAGYDQIPFEMASYDRSRLVGLAMSKSLA